MVLIGAQYFMYTCSDTAICHIVFGAFPCCLTSRLRRNARSIGSFEKKGSADKKNWLSWKSFGRSGTKMPHDGLSTETSSARLRLLFF